MTVESPLWLFLVNQGLLTTGVGKRGCIWRTVGLRHRREFWRCGLLPVMKCDKDIQHRSRIRGKDTSDELSYGSMHVQGHSSSIQYVRVVSTSI